MPQLDPQTFLLKGRSKGAVWYENFGSLSLVNCNDAEISLIRNIYWIETWVCLCGRLYWPVFESSSTTAWGRGDSQPMTAPSFQSWYTPHHHPAKWCLFSTPWLRKPGLCRFVLPASPADTTQTQLDRWEFIVLISQIKVNISTRKTDYLKYVAILCHLL